MARDIKSLLKGFSLIEIIVTIVILVVFIASIATMFQEIARSVLFSDDSVRVLNLAKLEISKVNNLSFADSTLDDGYNNTTSNYESSKYDLKRTVDIVPSTSDTLKKVEVTIYPTGTTDTLITLVTYVANIDFGTGYGAKSPTGYGEE